MFRVRPTSQNYIDVPEAARLSGSRYVGTVDSTSDRRRDGMGEVVIATKRISAAVAACVIALATSGVGTAHACEYQCYDSGNTGEHCEYTNC